jgi:exo-1,4-beta-D-glucosaminidase
MVKKYIALDEGWKVQCSKNINANGETISLRGFDDFSWYRAKIPATVVDVLVQNHVYEDIYYDQNLGKLPGMTYAPGTIFSKQEMDPNSPFASSWWYRLDFKLPHYFIGKNFRLIVKGINYRANLWINGKIVLDNKEMVGAFRRFNIDITDYVYPAECNVIAFEIFPPKKKDLAITFADWNPMPPDKNTGIWQEVLIDSSLGVWIENPIVNSTLETVDSGYATLKVNLDLSNTSHNDIRGQVVGTVRDREDKIVLYFSKEVEMTANSKQHLSIGDKEGQKMRIINPKLWWPYQMGDPYLYTLDLSFVFEDGGVSDETSFTFGICKVEGKANDDENFLLHINYKPFLVRGAGWTPDMLLRRDKTKREAEFEYVRDMGINTIRLEGKLDDDDFFNMADRYGITIIAGWSCADAWENWDIWDSENHVVARESVRDQIRRLINHPSVIVWMNGSDFHPPEEVERSYLDIEASLGWTRPILSSATGKMSSVSGPTRVKMLGPYDYVPPNYWYTATEIGGAKGFNTEAGPGAAIPPLESLRSFIPEDKLWPIGDVWNYHCGLQEFKSIDRFVNALTNRFGPADGLKDFIWKAEAMAYEGERAMFEAYTRNRYVSTGIVQWMLNNAWPSLIWHLYTYDLVQSAGYFAVKKSLELVHIQYSYDDSSIVVSNMTMDSFEDLAAEAIVYDFDMKILYENRKTVSLRGDSIVRVFNIPKLNAEIYFLKLSLTDKFGRIVSDNFYWFSSKVDALDYDKTTFYHTPQTSYADFRKLNELDKPNLEIKKHTLYIKNTQELAVSVSNTGKTMSFMTRLAAFDRKTGRYIAPAFYSDNYFTLMPNDTKVILIEAPNVDIDNVDVDITAFNYRK